MNKEEEIFKTIPSFPDYEVSNFGRVKTTSRKIRYTHHKTGMEHFRLSEHRFLKVQSNDYTGYKFHQLYRNKKMYNKAKHILVADAFLIRPDGADCVNHKDGNKHNNALDNLEWCTNAYNHKHATETGLKARGSEIGRSKLNEVSVRAIKKMLEDNIPLSQISRWFNVSRSSIYLIHVGKTWRHVSLTGTELKLIP